MDEIVGRLAASAPQPKSSVLRMPGAATLGDGRRTAGALAEGGDLTLTVETIPCPAVRICAELPPDEYPALIDEIRAAMEPLFRRYYGIHGKYVGDGMVRYFFPQPDCRYIDNALACAWQLNREMDRIDRAWRTRKGWLTQLHLNIGLNEDHDWLGTCNTPASIEIHRGGGDDQPRGAAWRPGTPRRHLGNEELRQQGQRRSPRPRALWRPAPHGRRARNLRGGKETLRGWPT
ncbi:MAG: hypothetical protein ACOZDY_08985 [Pseudomonadota bacterium]